MADLSLRDAAPPDDDGPAETIDLAPDLGDTTPLAVIEHDDGTVTVSLADPKPQRDPATATHDDNLAEDLDDAALGLLALEILDGVELDDMSRAEWLDERAKGIKLLGLKIDEPGADGTGGLEGMSTVRHPLLLEALLRFQANAMSELLPTDGPVKIRDDGQIQADDAMATALERGMNHYLTKTASEFYPDTDRMLWWVGLGGMAFKKVYNCPLRRRPVSEAIDAQHVIVSNDATDLGNATRITHVITMRRATLRRMVVVGAYRDVELVDDGFAPEETAVDEAEAEIEGRTVTGFERPEENERTIYEVYCDYELPGFEDLDRDGAPTGLPRPYKVTVDKGSRQVLEIRRNWREDDYLCLPIQHMVAFPYVRGMGFYGIGLAHIVGNTTNGLTAAWRIMLDAGMLANFPGGLIDKGATRQARVNFRAAPGEFIPVETGDRAIRDAVMPFPYKGPDEATMALVTDIQSVGQRIGGTAEINVGEGRQDAPVGTTLALIEQSEKVMNAVHKRLCAAQAAELDLLLGKFREDPEAFWRFNPRAQIQDEAALLQALDNFDLVPVADPNTASHMQRIQKMQAVQQLAKGYGPLASLYFDLGAINKASMEMLQLPNAERFLNPNPPPVGWMPPPPPGKGAGAGAPPPPDPVEQHARMVEAQATAQDADTRAKKAAADVQLGQGKLTIEAHKVQQGLGADPVETMDAQTRRMDAVTRQQGLQADVADNERDNANQAADRQSEDHIAALGFMKASLEHAHERQDAAADRGHASAEAALDRKADGAARAGLGT